MYQSHRVSNNKEEVLFETGLNSTSIFKHKSKIGKICTKKQSVEQCIIYLIIKNLTPKRSTVHKFIHIFATYCFNLI